MGKTDSKSRQPDFSFEEQFISAGRTTVAGVDEAGRGPLAGPVVAAAVILTPGSIPTGLNDSKALSPKRREELFDLIIAQAKVGVGIADVRRIDRDNILQATLWAMGEAVKNLPINPDAVLIDGNKAPPLTCETQTLVGGDGLSQSIAAASIIAKVTRDRMMIALAQKFPGFGWERNKGYGTAEHLAGLTKHGPTAHHRQSFAPVRRALTAR